MPNFRMANTTRSPDRDASSPGLTSDVGGIDRISESLPNRRELVQKETASCPRKDEKNDQASRDPRSVKASCDDYAPTLSLLSSRLNQEVTHMVDNKEMKAGTSGVDYSEPISSSLRGFSMPGSVYEAANGVKFSHGMASCNRNKELEDSDLCLSLGISKGRKRSSILENESPFAISNQTANLFSQSTHKQLALHMHSQYFASEATNKRLKPTETPAAQLTIFYGGLVHTYNDVPLDKARSIMLLAENANAFPANANQSGESPVRTQSHSVKPCQYMPHPSSSSSTLDPVAQSALDGSSAVSNSMSGLKPAVKVSYTALPQARRISLQRFLQKRTERSREMSPFAAQKSIDSGSTPTRSIPSSPCASGSRAPSPAP